MKIVIFSFGDIVGPVYRLIGNIFIGTTDAIQQEPDFYEPLGDRYIQNSIADVQDQSVLRAQFFGESVRRQLDQKLVTIGAIAVFIACMALILVAGVLEKGAAEWKAAAAKEKAAGIKEEREQRIKRGREDLKIAEAGFAAGYSEQCRSLFVEAFDQQKDPADNETYQAHCMESK
jgi:uncharacterized membrane protein